MSSRRYEMLVSDEMSDPNEVQSILEEEQGVLMQDNNCKLLYTEDVYKRQNQGCFISTLA